MLLPPGIRERACSSAQMRRYVDTNEAGNTLAVLPSIEMAGYRPGQK